MCTYNITLDIRRRKKKYTIAICIVSTTPTNGLEIIKVWWRWTQREMRTASRSFKVDREENK